MPVSVIPLGVPTQHTGSGVLHTACDLVILKSMSVCVFTCIGESRQKCVASWLDDQPFFMLVYLCAKSAKSSSSLGECM